MQTRSLSGLSTLGGRQVSSLKGATQKVPQSPVPWKAGETVSSCFLTEQQSPWRQESQGAADRYRTTHNCLEHTDTRAGLGSTDAAEPREGHLCNSGVTEHHSRFSVPGTSTFQSKTLQRLAVAPRHASNYETFILQEAISHAHRSRPAPHSRSPTAAAPGSAVMGTHLAAARLVFFLWGASSVGAASSSTSSSSSTAGSSSASSAPAPLPFLRRSWVGATCRSAG